MKTKILTSIIIVVALIAIAMSATSRSENSTQDENEHPTQHMEKVGTKLFSKNSSNVENKSEPIVSSHVSLEELAGHVNKEYGIREDILRYIEREIPPDNEKAKKAAITYAQVNQFIYYQATEENAIKAANRSLLAMHCLDKALPSRKYLIVLEKIDKLMRNTTERDRHMWNTDAKLFGWKVLGFGNLSTTQLNEICEKETY